MPWESPPTRTTDYKITASDDWNPVVQSLAYLEQVAYVERTTDTPIDGTTVGAADQIVSAGAIVYEAVPHLIEFWAPRATSAAVILNLILRDGTTVLGTLMQFASGEGSSPMYAPRVLIPTAASHTYNVAAWVEAAGTWTIEAGNGGAAGNATTNMPAFIRITRIPTAA